jgi:hypothetical protein
MCVSNEGYPYSQKVQVLQGEMPNVKPSFVDEKLTYLVTVGQVKVIKISGVTRDIKHDGTLETITVEHLTKENEFVAIFPSDDVFESAFTIKVQTLDENMSG